MVTVAPKLQWPRPADSKKPGQIKGASLIATAKDPE